MPDGTMLYLVAYDISSNKRRTKIHKMLSGFGKWTQYSLFECHLSQKQYLQLRHRLDDLMDGDEDSVRIYPLCGGCVEKVETFQGEMPNDPDTFIL